MKYFLLDKTIWLLHKFMQFMYDIRYNSMLCYQYFENLILICLGIYYS
nr:MAG TPA: hypothetical protein [Bacteriophage sp.]